MTRRRTTFAEAAWGTTVAVAVLGSACGPALPRSTETRPAAADGGAGCTGQDGHACDRATELVRAASTFGNVEHELLVDPTSAIAPGRCIVRSAAGAYALLPTRCAAEREPDGARQVDAAAIDFAYVGVTVDRHLVSADAELAPWATVGGGAEEHRIALVAMAFVRDHDPQFFTASPEVTFEGSACSAGRATHFVGAVKMGGLVSYEMRVRSGELHGQALDFVRARISARDARVTETVVGGLEVTGLEAIAGASPPREGAPRLGFHVASPVPIAYAVYPLSDVCRFSLPVPEVAPEVVDFGDVPEGREETRLLHVVNRAPFELRASLGDRTFALPGLGSLDVPLAWTPAPGGLGCRVDTREDTLVFTPRDAAIPAVPRMQTVRVTSRVRTGKPTFRRHEHVDTGVHAKPDYAATARTFQCPAEYVLASCRTENAACGDGRCASDGYAVNAAPEGNGCSFRCRGPEGLVPGWSSNFCRFDAVMECRLRCR